MSVVKKWCLYWLYPKWYNIVKYWDDEKAYKIIVEKNLLNKDSFFNAHSFSKIKSTIEHCVKHKKLTTLDLLIKTPSIQTYIIKEKFYLLDLALNQHIPLSFINILLKHNFTTKHPFYLLSHLLHYNGLELDKKTKTRAYEEKLEFFKLFIELHVKSLDVAEFYFFNQYGSILRTHLTLFDLCLRYGDINYFTIFLNSTLVFKTPQKSMDYLQNEKEKIEKELFMHYSNKKPFLYQINLTLIKLEKTLFEQNIKIKPLNDVVLNKNSKKVKKL